MTWFREDISKLYSNRTQTKAQTSHRPLLSPETITRDFQSLRVRKVAKRTVVAMMTRCACPRLLYYE